VSERLPSTKHWYIDGGDTTVRQQKWISLYPICPQWMRITDQSINQYFPSSIKLQALKAPRKKRGVRHWEDKDREFIYKNLIWGEMTMREAGETLGVSKGAIKNAWACTRIMITRGKYPGWTLPAGMRSRHETTGGRGSCCRRTEKRRLYIYNNLIWGEVSLQTAASDWGVSKNAIKKAWIRTRAAIKDGLYPGWKLPENRRNSHNKDSNIAI